MSRSRKVLYQDRITRLPGAAGPPRAPSTHVARSRPHPTPGSGLRLEPRDAPPASRAPTSRPQARSDRPRREFSLPASDRRLADFFLACRLGDAHFAGRHAQLSWPSQPGSMVVLPCLGVSFRTDNSAARNPDARHHQPEIPQWHPRRAANGAPPTLSTNPRVLRQLAANVSG